MKGIGSMGWPGGSWLGPAGSARTPLLEERSNSETEQTGPSFKRSKKRPSCAINVILPEMEEGGGLGWLRG